MSRCKRNATGLSKFVEICRRKVGENVEKWWYHGKREREYVFLGKPFLSFEGISLVVVFCRDTTVCGYVHSIPFFLSVCM